MALSLRAGVRLAGRWKSSSLGEYTNFALIAAKFGSAATENSCGLCKHHTMLEVANLIAVVGGDTTAHEVRQRARCHNCGVKGNGRVGHVRHLYSSMRCLFVGIKCWHSIIHLLKNKQCKLMLADYASDILPPD